MNFFGGLSIAKSVFGSQGKEMLIEAHDWSFWLLQSSRIRRNLAVLGVIFVLAAIWVVTMEIIVSLCSSGELTGRSGGIATLPIVKLICGVVEEIFSVVVRGRMEISGSRAATISLIAEAGALGEVVMMIVPLLHSLIWRGRAVFFPQFTTSSVRSKCRRRTQVVRFLELSDLAGT